MLMSSSPVQVFSLVFLVLISLSNCMLSNLLECGKANCSRSDNRFLALLGIISANTCSLPAEGSQGGLQDDPSIYDSFNDRIANTDWNETYIRKILHTFAWGGHATDAQIREWVAMGPSRAIIEILNADPVNPRLNQPILGGIATSPSSASITCISEQVAAGASMIANDFFFPNNPNSSRVAFPVIAQMKGLNPVRQVLGFMETNYHMATNAALVGARPQYRLYDETMNMIARGENYDRVLANGAVSAAIAIQYNHRKNRFTRGTFSGNEDFAREFHQLFFGILGGGVGSTSGILDQTNPTFAQHENETVPETAKILTDIRVGEFNSNDTNIDTVVFGTEFHIDRPMKIYGKEITGANAKEKIYNAAKEAIEHPESLQNLPLLLVRFLADDNLDESDITAITPTANQQLIQTKAASIRSIWKNLPQKNLLIFLRRYALSTAFFNETRIKYRKSADRIFTVSNLVTLTNGEISRQLHRNQNPLQNEDIVTFQPAHEVFGGQTGVEARDTADVFKLAYNTSSQGWNQWGLGNQRTGNVITYQKPYHLLIPRRADGTWRAKEVTEWLWNYLIGDGLKNLGNLERAHLYALLASGYDLSYFLAKDRNDLNINSISYGYGDGQPNDIATESELRVKIESDASVAILRLDDPGEAGNIARTSVGLAINFIISTPYMFVLEGK
jgi:hypothetical protein